MIILTIRTDKPEAEIGLYDSQNELGNEVWQAHRELSDTIHLKLQGLLSDHHKNWPDIEGIVIYKGPGSFTGLRIGISVANTLAGSLTVPILGASGDGWAKKGIESLLSGQNEIQVLPEYGADPHITLPKK